jgi:hypothetical protein
VRRFFRRAEKRGGASQDNFWRGMMLAVMVFVRVAVRGRSTLRVGNKHRLFIVSDRSSGSAASTA